MRVAFRVCRPVSALICPLDLITYSQLQLAVVTAISVQLSAQELLSTPLETRLGASNCSVFTAWHLLGSPKTAQWTARHLFGGPGTAQQTLWPDRRARDQLSTSRDLLSGS